jgi:hypothetical protein
VASIADATLGGNRPPKGWVTTPGGTPIRNFRLERFKNVRRMWWRRRAAGTRLQSGCRKLEGRPQHGPGDGAEGQVEADEGGLRGTVHGQLEDVHRVYREDVPVRLVPGRRRRPVVAGFVEVVPDVERGSGASPRSSDIPCSSFRVVSPPFSTSTGGTERARITMRREWHTQREDVSVRHSQQTSEPARLRPLWTDPGRTRDPRSGRPPTRGRRGISGCCCCAACCPCPRRSRSPSTCHRPAPVRPCAAGHRYRRRTAARRSGCRR